MSKQTENFYDRFSFFYPLVDTFLKPQKRKLFHEINRAPSGYLLEIGVGNGSHLHLYNRHQVIGIDTSLSMLGRARKQKCDGMELLEMDGEALLFPNETFDYVVLSHVLAVVDNPEKLLEETCRVLKPTGRIFILNHFTPKNWLRHVDNTFQFLSDLFHFKSVFDINNLKPVRKMMLIKEISLGRLSYFKLLIYSKA